MLKRFTWLLAAILICVSANAERAKPLSAEARAKLAEFAREVLAGKVDKVSSWSARGFPAELREKRSDEIFVTLVRDRAPAVRLGARKRSLLESVLAAVVKARLMPSFDFYDFGDHEGTFILFERVVERTTVPPDRWFEDLPRLELGVEGISLTHGDREGSLAPAAVFFDRLDDRDKFIGHLCQRLNVLPKAPRVRRVEALVWDPAKTRIERLAVETFLSRPGAGGVVELHRMNSPTVEAVGEPRVLALALGDRLASTQREDGRFVYVYDALAGRESDDYAIVPHAHAVVTLCDLRPLAGDKRYEKAIGRGVGFLLKQLRRGKTEGGEPMQFVVFDEHARLGDAAMTMIALDRFAEATGSKQLDATMKELGNFLVAMQYDDGSFRHYYDYDPAVQRRYKVSAAFPGQALWALVMLHRRFGDNRWLDAAEKSAQYLTTQREEQMQWTVPPPDVWLASGLRALREHRVRDEWFAYAARMSDATLAEQIIEPADLAGSFRSDPEGSVRGAAARARLLGETLLMRREGDAAKEEYLPAMKRSIAFIAHNLMTSVNTFYLDDPARTFGLPRVTAFENEIRLDTINHAIQALLGLAQAESKEKKP